jgi:hypothetical protein
MVPSSALTIVANGEHLSCDVFSLSKTICFGSLEFITDCFGGLSLSCMGDDSDAGVMGSTDGGTPSPLRAMTGDFVEEFHMAMDGKGRIDILSPRWHDMGASTAPTTTIPWPETTPTTQAMTTIILRQEASQKEPLLGEERILMIDYAPVRAQSKGEAPTASHEGGQAAAKALNASPPPTTDRVDKMYHQLAEIHAITATQLMECTCWHCSDSTPSLVCVRTGRQRPDETPSVTRMVPPPLTDSPPKPCCVNEAHMLSPRCTDGSFR